MDPNKHDNKERSVVMVFVWETQSLWDGKIQGNHHVGEKGCTSPGNIMSLPIPLWLTNLLEPREGISTFRRYTFLYLFFSLDQTFSFSWKWQMFLAICHAIAAEKGSHRRRPTLNVCFRPSLDEIWVCFVWCASYHTRNHYELPTSRQEEEQDHSQPEHHSLPQMSAHEYLREGWQFAQYQDIMTVHS